MAKVATAEATARRQAVSFVLGCVVTLTVVLLLQQRRPEQLTRPTAPAVQFFGWRTSSSSSGHDDGNTPSSPSTSTAAAGSPPAILAADQQAANATKQQPATDTNSSAAATTADDVVRCLPATPAHRQQEGKDDADDAAEDEFRGLAAAVARAATADDRTVIITCVNQAWAAPGSLLDLFLESFRVGDGIAHLLGHVLIVAMDPTAMARCRALRHPHCYLFTMPGIDFTSAKFFLSKEYLELVWSKLKLQRRVLQLGYNFLFTDVDILWFRNPFKHVTAYADMSISSDVFFGDPDRLDNFPNTGFFHVRPNNRTIAMTKLWHEARERYPGMNEQPVFNAIKKGLVADLGLRVQYMDPAFVGGFCSYGKDLRKICTMHANCCVGLANKLRDLRSVLADWNNFTAMPHWSKHNARWTVPGACIH